MRAWIEDNRKHRNTGKARTDADSLSGSAPVPGSATGPGKAPNWPASCDSQFRMARDPKSALVTWEPTDVHTEDVHESPYSSSPGKVSDCPPPGLGVWFTNQPCRSRYRRA